MEQEHRTENSYMFHLGWMEANWHVTKDAVRAAVAALRISSGKDVEYSVGDGERQKLQEFPKFSEDLIRAVDVDASEVQTKNKGEWKLTIAIPSLTTKPICVFFAGGRVIRPGACKVIENIAAIENFHMVGFYDPPSLKFMDIQEEVCVLKEPLQFMHPQKNKADIAKRFIPAAEEDDRDAECTLVVGVGASGGQVLAATTPVSDATEGAALLNDSTMKGALKPSNLAKIVKGDGGRLKYARLIFVGDESHDAVKAIKEMEEFKSVELVVMRLPYDDMKWGEVSREGARTLYVAAIKGDEGYRIIRDSKSLQEPLVNDCWELAIKFARQKPVRIGINTEDIDFSKFWKERMTISEAQKMTYSVVDLQDGRTLVEDIIFLSLEPAQEINALDLLSECCKRHKGISFSSFNKALYRMVNPALPVPFLTATTVGTDLHELDVCINPELKDEYSFLPLSLVNGTTSETKEGMIPRLGLARVARLLLQGDDDTDDDDADETDDGGDGGSTFCIASGDEIHTAMSVKSSLKKFKEEISEEVYPTKLEEIWERIINRESQAAVRPRLLFYGLGWDAEKGSRKVARERVRARVSARVSERESE
eukprot:GHVU01107175.1.p1 GENE.GHVU01107175.1~~GHVU01107175.1.p1  ORF type:complete len:595 (-),score=89.24 GHVU01107175.1:1101-2885(-)